MRNERKGKDRSTATWMKYAWPLICGFVGIVPTLAVLHGKEV